MTHDKKLVILIADDDEDDRLMTKEAFEELQIKNELFFVKDGVELMDYLNHEGDFAHPNSSPRPCLILLDLNMPRMDGREALRSIKENNILKSIPISIFSTSKAEEDVLRSYNLGVNCFITKPVTYKGLVNTISQLNSFWFELVSLPMANT